MPWTNESAPNFILELTDACNISCRSCFKKRGEDFRSVREIEQDLDIGLFLRPAHTVTLSGGEPTLHPELPGIIEIVKKRGVHVFLLTNGVKADAPSLREWKRRGLDSILFHVEPGQDRPDLSAKHDTDPVSVRLSELVDMAFSAGLDVSVSVTLYEDSPETLGWITRFVFESPKVGFLFLSKGMDMKKIPPVRSVNSSPPPFLSVAGIQAFFEGLYGIKPFSYIPSTGERNTCWISYFVPIAYRGNGMTYFKYQSNVADQWLMRLQRLIAGRFTHKLKQSRRLTFLRTTINGLTTLRFLSLLGFLRRFVFGVVHAGHKVIVYDDGPAISADGTIECCEYCPTAVVRGNELLACCAAGRENSREQGYDPL